MFLYRPAICENPFYNIRDIHEWVELKHVLDANEALDLRMAIMEKQNDSS